MENLTFKFVSKAIKIKKYIAKLCDSCHSRTGHSKIPISTFETETRIPFFKSLLNLRQEGFFLTISYFEMQRKESIPEFPISKTKVRIINFQ